MAIQFVGYNAAAGITTTLPLGTNAYDVAVVFAIQHGTPSRGPAVTIPTGWTAGPVVQYTGSGSDPLVQSAWKVLGPSSGGDSIGDWTLADLVWVVVYRGVSITTPFGNSRGEAPLNRISYISALAYDDGTSWVVACGVASNTGMGATIRDSVAAGMVNRGSGGPPTELWTGLWDTGAGVAAFADYVSILGGAGNAAHISIELVKSTTALPETPYTWEIIAGALPAGLTLDADTGEISGTPTADDGVYIFSIVAYNNYFSTPTFTCQITVVGTGLTAATYSIDLEKLVSNQQLVWQRTKQVMMRPAIINGTDLYYSDGDDIVQKVDTTAVATGGYWTSPNLNRSKRHNDYTLTELLLKYQTSESTYLNVFASGDGGKTWKEPINTYAPLVSSGQQVRRVRTHFNVTGSDVRFKIEFDDDVIVWIHEYEAKLIEREGIRRF